MLISTTIKQNPVASFIILTLGLSFAAFLLPVPPESAFAAVVSVDVMIPTLVAIALVSLMQGRLSAADFSLAQPIEMVSHRPCPWYHSLCRQQCSGAAGDGLAHVVRSSGGNNGW